MEAAGALFLFGWRWVWPRAGGAAGGPAPLRAPAAAELLLLLAPCGNAEPTSSVGSAVRAVGSANQDDNIMAPRRVW